MVNSNFNKGMTKGGEPVMAKVENVPTFTPSKTFQVPEDMLVYAFRYAIGRHTYVAQEVSSELRAHTLSLSNKTKALIVKEIKDADGLGLGADRDEWMRTANVLSGGKDELA